ncbi:hypothetical protein BDP81DRAFT_437005 [Colletotrichum phormii]|uniref:Uncharacterized protein n=1 Tax=Colletotrichum phormii TaxID=359342 RepID=A0AAJ0EAX9_9PEZI|nr:uncharacterized protein BDP81DRAFT_437005 [Colletotrichum phormii]KAK1625036.1 hypothetical protein BDP81DRAFT_437005 [Colletotrichum phormii]
MVVVRRGLNRETISAGAASHGLVPLVEMRVKHYWQLQTPPRHRISRPSWYPC